MRIAFLSPRAADPARLPLLRALRALGHDLQLVAPEQWTDAGGRLRRTAAGALDGFPCHPVATSSDDETTARWQARALKRVLRDLRPDLVHVEAEPWSPLAAGAVRLAGGLGLPSTLHVARITDRAEGVLARWRQRRVLGAVAGLAAASSAALARWPDSAARTRTVIARLTSDAAPPPPALPSDRLRIGFVGRLVPERGCDLLLRALPQVHGQWSVEIAGSGPSQAELEGLAARLGLAARVQWLGGLPEPERLAWWERIDVLVMPSRRTERWAEEHAVLLREAMARGVAVVTSGTGALADATGPAGVVVPDEDPVAIGEALQVWHDLPEARADAGHAARQRILGHFTPGAVAAALDAFWRSARG